MTEELDGATPVEGGQEPSVETPIDVEKTDNVSQVREWGKTWKTSAEQYEPSHKFVTEKFGDLSQAEVAHELYTTLFDGQEFNPENFIKVMEKISPNRSKQLIENFAKDKAQALVPQALKELFGDNPTKEEISLFKQWKESGMFGQGEDIPDFLKFDAEGNPRSEEEIEWYRNLKKQTDSVSRQTEAQKEERARAEASQREAEIEQRVEEFATGSLSVLEPDLEAYGLAPAPTDTSEVREEKEFLRNFILGGVKEAFIKNKEALDAYNSAVKHISSGEPLLAKRYEPKVKQALLTALRSKPLEKLLNGLKSSTPPTPPRQEISNSSSTTTTPPKGERFNVQDRIKSLFQEGKLIED